MHEFASANTPGENKNTLIIQSCSNFLKIRACVYVYVCVHTGR
jgi:hypothetical protein